jgi:MFS transporter, putative metabolite:H+ symporter
MRLDSIINERVGFGRFQVFSFALLCLIDFNDGVEIILASFLNAIVKTTFTNASTAYVSSLVTVFYVGSLFGSLLSGSLADKHGRRSIIRVGAWMQIGASLLFYFADSLFLMFWIRLLYGFAFGFTITVSTSAFAEISPEKYRGKGVLLINFFISIGKLYAVMLGYLFLCDNLAETNWKLMIACGAIPNLIVALGSTMVMTETPRFLMAQHRFEEGIEVLNRMIRTNKGDEGVDITAEE